MENSFHGHDLILSKDHKTLVDKLLKELDKEQISWLGGYLTGLNFRQSPTSGIPGIPQQPSTSPTQSHKPESHEAGSLITPEGLPRITFLYGTKTGNSKKLAEAAHKQAVAKGFESRCIDTNDYKTRELANEKYLFLVVSTDGEGEPPIGAESFYEFLHGKRVSTLQGLNYSVLALGDRSYTLFCKTGIDFDKRFSDLGAKRIFERTDCDVDYEDDAQRWATGILNILEKEAQAKQGAHAVLPVQHVAATPIPQAVTTSYSRKNPFKAEVLEKIQLNGRGSGKETHHLELLIENSGLIYQPGDSLGIYAHNSAELVDNLIAFKKFNPEYTVRVNEKVLSLREALIRHYEIGNLNRDVIVKYADLAKREDLKETTQDPSTLNKYLYGRDLIDLFREYPTAITEHQLTTILPKLQPRLYSIASSPNAHPGEVHLTVGTVRYEHIQRSRNGVCSTYLADQIQAGQTLPVFIEENIGFRLPQATDTDCIFIGPGTGIAPFRAFLEEREYQGHAGRNWLFYGDWNFSTDFLYQTELQRLYKNGTLSRINVAFSRDQAQKIYVQHRMLEQSAELYKWLQDGASIYVCGDKNRMAADVHQTLVQIVAKEGKLSHESAVDYIKQLRRSKRYQEDVY